MDFIPRWNSGMMRMSESRIKQTQTAATINHFFFAVFPSPFTLVLYDENNWRSGSSALLLVVALGSGDLGISRIVATCGEPGSTGTACVLGRVFGFFEARVGDPSADSFADSCCLTMTGAGVAETDSWGLSTKDFGVAPRSTVCPSGFGVSLKE